MDADTLEVALRHAAELYSNRKVWARMQRNGMATDVSWRRPAHHYPALYRDLLRLRREEPLLRPGAAAVTVDCDAEQAWVGMTLRPRAGSASAAIALFHFSGEARE